MADSLDIAFCIFGQLRDDHIHLPAIAKLAADVNASVFISTWRRRGTKTSGVINRDQIIRMFGYEFGSAIPAPLVGDSRFNDAIPDYEATVQEAFAGNTVTQEYLLGQIPGAVVDIEDETLNLDFPPPVPSDRNSLRMLYKVWRCNELKRAAEKQRGRAFDIVVRFRPDVLPKLDIAQLTALRDAQDARTVLFHGGKPGATYLGDVITVSNSALADQMAMLFGVAMRHPSRKWDNIHTEIPRHMKELGLSAGNVDLSHWVTEDFARSQPRNREHILGLLDQDRVNPAIFGKPSTWPAVRQLLHAAATVEARRGRSVTEAALSGIAFDQEDTELAGRAAFLLARASEHAKEPALMLAARSLEMLCRVDARGDGALGDKGLPAQLQSILQLSARLGVSEPLTWRAVERMLAPASGVPVLRRLTIAARSLTPAPQRLAAERRIARALPEPPSAPPGLADGLATVQDLMVAGQSQAAASALQALAEAFPESFQPPAWLGDLMLSMGKAADALAAYRKAAELPGGAADMHAMASFCCQRLGDASGAIEAAQRARAAAPDNAMLVSRLAMLFTEQGRHAEAEPVWRDASTRLSTDPWALRMFAGCLVALGNKDEAASVLTRALEAAPGDAETGAAHAKLLGARPAAATAPAAAPAPSPPPTGHLRAVAPPPLPADGPDAAPPVPVEPTSAAWQVLLGKAPPPAAPPAVKPPERPGLLRRLFGRGAAPD